jgi:hypothetical protein
MTKARTKAARRKRSNKISLPGGASVQSKPTAGHRSDIEATPADAIAIAARAKITGCTVEEARDVLAGEDMGRCIRYVTMHLKQKNQVRRDMLTVWQGLVASWHNYKARYLSLPPGPQTIALLMQAERIETNQSPRVDIRSAAERAEAARASWLGWDADLKKLRPIYASALRGHLQDYGAAVWNPITQQPTKAGHLAAEAVASLHKIRHA